MSKNTTNGEGVIRKILRDILVTIISLVATGAIIKGIKALRKKLEEQIEKEKSNA